MRKEIVRKIANKLNEMGHPCCRCLDCDTCKKAEEIYKIARNATPFVDNSLAEQMQAVGH